MAQQPRGRLITVEGGEGVGKSTLSAALARKLEAQGHNVLRTREPGGTPGAEAVRSVLLGEGCDWSPLSQALLFTAARNDHLERVIRPALRAGRIVLCDRYLDSMIAYQAAAGGVGEEVCSQLAALIGAVRPDLTLLLDLDPAIGLQRSQSGIRGEGAYEARGLPYHQAVRARFLDLAAAEPERFWVIDAGGDQEKVLESALHAALTLVQAG